jgi:quercetin dioxygenase-like cupin family protein
VIRCVRLSSGEDGQSHVETGAIALDRAGEAGPSKLSELMPAQRVSFEETPPTSSLAWHTAPHRQFVITVSGELDFVTRDGEKFRLDPHTVLLAEDTAGGGHRWSIVGSEPWRRVYVRLPADAAVPFTPDAG